MALFSLGRLCATRGVADLGERKPAFDRHVRQSLDRYVRGAWGDMCADDKKLNDDAVAHGETRIFAAYEYAGQPEWKIWIITEHDRSYTTVLFPGEY